MTFRDKVRAKHPGIARRAQGHAVKRNLAFALRSIRKVKGISQKDIENHSGLAQAAVSRLEAPSGPLPNLETIRRYLDACDVDLDIGLYWDSDLEIASLVLSPDVGVHFDDDRDNVWTEGNGKSKEALCA